MTLKTLCAFLALVLELLGVYSDGEFRLCYGYSYMAVILNFSQLWALYYLVQFNNITHERLEPLKPLAKFISFKAIVFVTWWQGAGIALLCALGVLPKEGTFQSASQDFLICIEMAIAALLTFLSSLPNHIISCHLQNMVSCPTQTTKLALEEADEEKPAVYEKTETEIEAPGTSVRESAQDIVVEGGQHVVKMLC